MRYVHSSFIGIVMALSIAGSAQAADFGKQQCPAEISPGDINIVARPGWKTHAPYSLPLFGAGMSAGPPESEMTLRGEPLDAKGDSTSYSFGGPDDERWLDCRYGRSGEFTMSRRLDSGIKQCVITHFKLAPGNPRRVDIRCH